jgi:nucleotide-binding universal stress UspA family protein
MSISAMTSALIATDFSDEARSALLRAVSIAKETGLHGALAHVLPDSLPASLHVQAASQAQQALVLLAEEMKREGLRFEPRLLSGNVAEQLDRAAADFDMVIAGARGAGLLLDFTLGRTSTRLVRHSRRPTLIVKRPPEEPYRRVVAAVDFSAPSRQAAACAVQIAPQAQFHFAHAFEVEFESALRFAGAEEDKVQAYRRQAREQAMEAMEKFIGALALPSERAWPSVTRGYPPKVIVDCEAEVGAQLVVLGKHAAGLVEHVLIGSVALRVLERAQCDVLVVPAA